VEEQEEVAVVVVEVVEEDEAPGVARRTVNRRKLIDVL